MDTEEEWDKAADIVLKEERKKRKNSTWVPTFHNGAFDFSKKVEELLKNSGRAHRRASWGRRSV